MNTISSGDYKKHEDAIQQGLVEHLAKVSVEDSESKKSKVRKFTEKDIRAVRGVELAIDRYSVHAELLVKGEWTIPYLVQEDKLNWADTDEELNPTEKNMKEYLRRQLNSINSYLSEGYKLVSYDKYKRVIHKYHYPLESEPKVVYL